MGRTVWTEDQIAWVKSVYPAKTPGEIASYLGYDTTTVKRLLVRLGLAEFPAAKYQPSRLTTLQTWTRPCSGCGCTKPRPKWRFYCDPCAVRLGHGEGGAMFDD